MEGRRRKCPACGERLVIERHAWGLWGKTPRRCTSCHTPLLYDTAGGVYVDDRRDTDPTDPPSS